MPTTGKTAWVTLDPNQAAALFEQQRTPDPTEFQDRYRLHLEAIANATPEAFDGRAVTAIQLRTGRDGKQTVRVRLPTQRERQQARRMLERMR